MLLRFLKSVAGFKDVKSGLGCMHAAFSGHWFETRCRECRIVTIQVCIDCFNAKAVPLLCHACEKELSLFASEAYKLGGTALKDAPVFGTSQMMTAEDDRNV